MGYQSRKRNYSSRRERWQRHKRNTRLILIFGGIALLVLLFKNRYPIMDWAKTYFY